MPPIPDIGLAPPTAAGSAPSLFGKQTLFGASKPTPGPGQVNCGSIQSHLSSEMFLFFVKEVLLSKTVILEK
jgi:hypothetical protein